MTVECWKNINGYEGIYEVSDLGRVRSVKRTFLTNNCHGGRTPRTFGEKIMKPIDNGNGYQYVKLSYDGDRRNHYIHRLVAEAFCDNPHGYNEVNHKDFDKHNNNAENLEWCEREYNVNYSAGKMRKPKSSCKKTNTGIKYISLRTAKGRKPVFRVNVRQKNVCKQFKTLSEARRFLEEVMKDGV